MRIFVSRAGQQLGPFSLEDGRQIILAGHGQTSDGKRAVAHKDGTVAAETFTLPAEY